MKTATTLTMMALLLIGAVLIEPKQVIGLFNKIPEPGIVIFALTVWMLFMLAYVTFQSAKQEKRTPKLQTADQGLPRRKITLLLLLILGLAIMPGCITYTKVQFRNHNKAIISDYAARFYQPGEVIQVADQRGHWEFVEAAWVESDTVICYGYGCFMIKEAIIVKHYKRLR